MWLPKKTYEALPVLYLAVGMLIILGAIYIGASHGLMPGYIVLGLLCMTGGVIVWNIRRIARSRAEGASSQILDMVMDQTTPSMH